MLLLEFLFHHILLGTHLPKMKINTVSAIVYARFSQLADILARISTRSQPLFPDRQCLCVPLRNMLPGVTIQAVMILQKYHANMTTQLVLCFSNRVFRNLSGYLMVDILALRNVCRGQGSRYGYCHKFNVDIDEKHNHFLHLTGELHLPLYACIYMHIGVDMDKTLWLAQQSALFSLIEMLCTIQSPHSYHCLHV